MIAGFSGIISYYNDLPRIPTPETYLSYLPLPHILERIAMVSVIYLGSQIAFSNPKLLTEDIKIIKPTVLTGVPRVFDR